MLTTSGVFIILFQLFLRVLAAPPTSSPAASLSPNYDLEPIVEPCGSLDFGSWERCCLSGQQEFIESWDTLLAMYTIVEACSKGCRQRASPVCLSEENIEDSDSQNSGEGGGHSLLQEQENSGDSEEEGGYSKDGEESSGQGVLSVEETLWLVFGAYCTLGFILSFIIMCFLSIAFYGTLFCSDCFEVFYDNDDHLLCIENFFECCWNAKGSKIVAHMVCCICIGYCVVVGDCEMFDDKGCDDESDSILCRVVLILFILLIVILTFPFILLAIVTALILVVPGVVVSMAMVCKDAMKEPPERGRGQRSRRGRGRGRGRGRRRGRGRGRGRRRRRRRKRRRRRGRGRGGRRRGRGRGRGRRRDRPSPTLQPQPLPQTVPPSPPMWVTLPPYTLIMPDGSIVFPEGAPPQPAVPLGSSKPVSGLALNESIEIEVESSEGSDSSSEEEEWEQDWSD